MLQKRAKARSGYAGDSDCRRHRGCNPLGAQWLRHGMAARRRLGRRAALAALAWVVVAPFALAAGPSSAPRTSPSACPAAGSASAAYRIGAGDVLRVAVWNDSELDRTVTVRPDGMISFPLLDDVRAAGLTPMELQDAMTAGLRRYVSNPQLSVVVKDIRSFVVSVLGQVQHPGRYPIQSNDVTVLDALAQAGGFTSFASRSSIWVLRHDAGGTRRLPFHYGKAVSRDPGGADFCLQPSDIIVVH